MEGSTAGVVTLILPADAALVLDALLADLNEPGTVLVDGAAELQALWVLSGALEKVLVDTFKPDYKDLLQAARERLAQEHG